MKHYAKTGTIEGNQAPQDKPEEPQVSGISVDRLMEDGLLCLYREMRNLKLLSSKGKLDASSSRDLRDTVKLLFELKEREKEFLKGKSDEELKALLLEKGAL
jgi:hypothetical protein